MTAIGSLRPDSSSTVAATRCCNCTPLPRRTEKTAAASVEATTAPISRASSGRKPSAIPASPTPPVVNATPRVARTPAGAQAERTTAIGVFRPPSKRMKTSAMVPMRKARP